LEISYLGERIGLKTPCISRCGHRYPFFCSFIACAPPAAVGEQGKKSACFFPLVLGKQPTVCGFRKLPKSSVL